MLYYLFFAALLVSDALSLFCMVKTTARRDRLGQATMRLLGASVLVSTFYLLMLAVPQYSGKEIAYTAYYVSTDWICLLVLSFSLIYTGKEQAVRWVSRIMVPLMVVASLSWFGNLFFHHIADFLMIDADGLHMLALAEHAPYLLHLLLCYLMLLAAMGVLISGILHAPDFYKSQYRVVLIFLVLIVALNAAFLLTSMDVNISIALYGLLAVCLHYYTCKHMPKQLMLQMSAVVTDALDHGVVLFSGDGSVLYRNETAKKAEYGSAENQEELCAFLGFHAGALKDEFHQEVTRSGRIGRQALDVACHILRSNPKNPVSAPVGNYVVIEDITSRREQLIMREYRARHDLLTGLYNRSYFYERAEQLIEENVRVPYAILVMDIYQFKIYNEVFGQKAGDELLKDIAASFINVAKSPDIVYCRYDADRFAACLPLASCRKMQFEKYSFSPQQNSNYQVVTYIGICTVPEEVTPISVLCERAGIALNSIKGDASVHYTFYDQKVRDALLRENQISSDFPGALIRRELLAYIQPQFDQYTGELAGGELLVRWRQPDGSIASPGSFISILEKTGQITELDRFIWEEGCRLAKEFQDKGIPVALSVNISAKDFFRCDIYEVFVNLVERYGLSCEYLKLEITETGLMSDVGKILPIIRKLQEYGFTIEMDDFGSGYSSLNTLKDIPVDVLKLDLNFLRGSGSLERSRIILKNVIAMARELGLVIIVEGVETQEQADYLKELNCHYVQGFWFGHPMPVEEFEKLRRERSFRSLMPKERNH